MFMAGTLAALALCAATAGAANATAEWRFGGTLLSGAAETVELNATKASLTIPGLTTTCEPFAFELTVENPGGGGAGVGKVTGVPLNNCYTNSKFCPVEWAQAASTPWPVRLTTLAGQHYLVIEGVKIAFMYGGELCALNETEVVVKGTAGGLVNDLTHTVTFSASSFTATGTMLKALGSKIEMNGVFGLAATGANAGLAVTVL
jgi:hypothetical protein